MELLRRPQPRDGHDDRRGAPRPRARGALLPAARRPRQRPGRRRRPGRGGSRAGADPRGLRGGSGAGPVAGDAGLAELARARIPSGDAPIRVPRPTLGRSSVAPSSPRRPAARSPSATTRWSCRTISSPSSGRSARWPGSRRRRATPRVGVRLQQRPAPPAVLAQELASLDVLSGGRLDVAIGAGWNKPEYDAIGLAFDPVAGRVSAPDRGDRGAEGAVRGGAVLVRRRALHDHGLDGQPKPIQRPHPPFFIGGGGGAR